MTRNEIDYSLNKPDDFILAIVEFLDADTHRLHYLRHPFGREPDFGVTSVNYDFAELPGRVDSAFHLLPGVYRGSRLSGFASRDRTDVPTPGHRRFSGSGTTGQGLRPQSETRPILPHALDEVLAGQDADFDSDSQWALAWFEHAGFAEGEYGIAEFERRQKTPASPGWSRPGSWRRAGARSGS